MIMCSTIPPCAWALFREVAAPVNSAPLWQKMQPPLFEKTWNPCSCSVDRAEMFPSIYRSKGASSETSVDSYSMIDKPQNKEKFFTIWGSFSEVSLLEF